MTQTTNATASTPAFDRRAWERQERRRISAAVISTRAEVAFATIAERQARAAETRPGAPGWSPAEDAAFWAARAATDAAAVRVADANRAYAEALAEARRWA